MVLRVPAVEPGAEGAENKQSKVAFSDVQLLTLVLIKSVGAPCGTDHLAHSAAGTHDILYTKHTDDVGLIMETGAEFEQCGFVVGAVGSFFFFLLRHTQASAPGAHPLLQIHWQSGM